MALTSPPLYPDRNSQVNCFQDGTEGRRLIPSIQDIRYLTKFTDTSRKSIFEATKTRESRDSWLTSTSGSAGRCVCLCATLSNCVTLSPSCPASASLYPDTKHAVCFCCSGSEKTRGSLGSPAKTDKGVKCCQSPRQQKRLYFTSAASKNLIHVFIYSWKSYSYLFKLHNSFFFFVFYTAAPLLCPQTKAGCLQPPKTN